MARGSIKGITIEIGGNTTKLSKALSEVGKNIRSTQADLREVEKALKMDPGNTDLIKQKQKLLNEEIEHTRQKIEYLEQAKKQEAETMMTEGKAESDTYQQLSRDIDIAKAQVSAYERELKKLPNHIQEIGKNMQEVGKKASDLGDKLTTHVTAPIIAIGAASAVAFNEIDDGMDTIIKKTGASGEAAEKMKEVYENLLTSLPTDAETAGNAVGEVNTQFGIMDEALQVASEKLIKFAQINDTDVTQSTQKAKKAIDTFGMSGNDLGDVLDAVTKVGQDTGVAVDKIFDSAIKGGPQIKSLGLSFAEGAVLIGQFEKSGIDADKALGYLSKAQVTLAKDGTNLTDGLEELEKKIKESTSETDKLAEASKIFGTKGAVFMLDAIERGQLSFDGLAGAANQAQGSVENTFEGIIDPIDQVTVATNQLKLAGTELFGAIQEVFLPYLNQGIAKLREFNTWFKSLSPAAKENIVKIMAIVAALGPLLSIGGRMITGIGKGVQTFGNLTKAMGAASAAGSGAGAGMLATLGPILLVIAAVAALIAIFTHLWKTNEKFRDDVTRLWEEIRAKISGILSSLGEIISLFLGLVSAFWNKWGDGILEKTGAIFNAILAVIQFALNLISGIIKIITGIITGDWSFAWEGVKQIVKAALEFVSNIISAAFDLISSFIGDKMKIISEGMSQKWTEIRDGTKQKLGEAKDFIYNSLNETANYTEAKLQIMKAAYDRNGGGIRGTMAAVMTGMKSLWQDGMNVLNAVTDGKVGEMLNSFVQKTTAIKIQAENIMNLIKTVINEGLEKVKKLFDFEWSLPKIPLPHFSLSGKFDPLRGNLPSLAVDWYDKGGIFTGPQIIGVGEKRPEFVGALDDLRAIVRDEAGVNNEGMILLMKEMLEEMKALNNGIGKKMAEAVEGMGISIDKRPFGRIVKEVI